MGAKEQALYKAMKAEILEEKFRKYNRDHLRPETSEETTPQPKIQDQR